MTTHNDTARIVGQDDDGFEIFMYNIDGKDMRFNEAFDYLVINKHLLASNAAKFIGGLVKILKTKTIKGV